MSDFRRKFVPGGMYFFTVVTYQRRRFLTDEIARSSLREAFMEVNRMMPFNIFAIVLLPEHLHMVMQLPPNDAAYPIRWKRIKESFTRRWLERGGRESPVTESERKRGRRGVWQPRYWEHTVRDEPDLERCVDYTHWNPRKHGLVTRVKDWKWSSFSRFVREGQYELNWGGEAPIGVEHRDWGEPV